MTSDAGAAADHVRKVRVSLLCSYPEMTEKGVKQLTKTTRKPFSHRVPYVLTTSGRSSILSVTLANIWEER